MPMTNAQSFQIVRYDSETFFGRTTARVREKTIEAASPGVVHDVLIFLLNDFAGGATRLPTLRETLKPGESWKAAAWLPVLMWILPVAGALVADRCGGSQAQPAALLLPAVRQVTLLTKPRASLSLALELPGRVANNPLQRELTIRRGSFGGASAPRLSLTRHSPLAARPGPRRPRTRIQPAHEVSSSPLDWSR